MTMKFAHGVEDFANQVADAIFEDLQADIHNIDEQSAEQGLEAPELILLILARLASNTLGYAAYMSAGMYLCDKDDKDVARGAVKALLRDQKRAAERGLELAEKKATEIKEQMREASELLPSLLKARKGGDKTCH